MNKYIKNHAENIATSRLGAQHLLSAGLDPATADMRWNMSHSYQGKPILESFKISDPVEIRYNDGKPFGKNKYIPAWSLGRLIEIAGATPNVNRPDHAIAALVNHICLQLENGGGIPSQSQHITAEV